MAGHSKWHQIKHKKEMTDQKRSRLFSKLLSAIQSALIDGSNPDFNPRLRAAINKAKEMQVPQENILRAIQKIAKEPVDKLIVEAYGPGGAALIIEAISSNKNQTVANIKKTLLDFDAKVANPGAVIWIFEEPPFSFKEHATDLGYRAKFKQPISSENKDKLNKLIAAFKERDEVIGVYTNAIG